jgi:aminoglycoside phosphotransferase (APT) family kinase protein
MIKLRVKTILRPIRRLRRRIATGRAVREVVTQHLGRSPQWIRAVQPVYTTITGIVYEVGFPDTTLIFKAALYRYGTVATEAWAYERIRERGVPAPRVLAVDATCTTFPTPYVILEQVSGVPLSDPSLQGRGREALLRESGELLRRMHAVEISGYGLLDEELYVRTGRVSGLHQTWRPAVLRRLHWGLPYIERLALLDRSEVMATHRALDRHAAVLDALWPSRLLHGDFQNKHVFVDPSTTRITGFIDFGNRESGDVAWDLARFCLREGGDLKHLLEGYEADPRERETLQERIPFYLFLHAFSDVRKYHSRGRLREAGESLQRLRRFLDSERTVRPPVVTGRLPP